jgi:phosphatidylinositol kinase/protein kinase (PI-3  family)
MVEQVPYFPCHLTLAHFSRQALVVSQELIRVAILWHELWHEGLEEASRLYFTEKNPEGMIAALEPLHDMLEAVSYSFTHCY